MGTAVSERGRLFMCPKKKGGTKMGRMTESLKSEAVRLYFEENREESEIAEALNVKKPSVSLAMKQLKERGLVEYTQYSPIVLTREGRYYADRVISCHTMVKEFLITVLKMEEKRADEVACGIEHIMTLEEISRFQLLTEHCRKSGE